MKDKTKYFCDNQQHLICVPYNVEALHDMAADLDIKRSWFHNKKGKEHYDIPSRRIAEITERCELVSPKEIIAIMEGTSWRFDVNFCNIVDRYEQYPLSVNGYDMWMSSEDYESWGDQLANFCKKK